MTGISRGKDVQMKIGAGSHNNAAFVQKGKQEILANKENSNYAILIKILYKKKWAVALGKRA